MVRFNLSQSVFGILFLSLILLFWISVAWYLNFIVVIVFFSVRFHMLWWILSQSNNIGYSTQPCLIPLLIGICCDRLLSVLMFAGCCQYKFLICLMSLSISSIFLSSYRSLLCLAFSKAFSISIKHILIFFLWSWYFCIVKVLSSSQSVPETILICI